MKILITGGAGYIGSHTCLILLEHGYELTVYDNLSNSSLEALRRVEELTGSSINFIQGDILDKVKLDAVFDQNSFDCVIHFAGLKSVGESVDMPLHYYQNNVTGTLNLLEVMQKYNVYSLVFSSSATVYGYPEKLPITEDAPRSTTNPYGTSKLMIEYILEDLVRSNLLWKVVSLRYFNPVGAHSSGKIGEDPNDIPNNLMPYIAQVAIGLRDKLNVFGGDYPTKDGTGVRDYIHVVDLANGHLSALEYLQKTGENRFLAINLGTGQGYSVLEMIAAFSKASGQEVPYVTTKKRQGDVAECYADPSFAYNTLGWKAKLDINDMCKDTWNWQKQNPNGYKGV